MDLILEAFAWILDPANSVGSEGIPVRVAEQLAYTVGAVLMASVVAVPLGYAIGHTGRGRSLAIRISGGLRALPSFGLLIVLALALGIGFQAPLISFTILALPPLLAGAYAGIDAIDRDILDSARATGMTGWQVLTMVEIPLGLPLLIAGVRSAMLQVVATATLAFFASGGALGVFINLGLKTRDYSLMLGASIVVTALAIVIELVLVVVQRLVAPRGVVAPSTHPRSIRISHPRGRAPAPRSRQEARL